MPYRTSFDCLWCGRRHAVRGQGDAVRGQGDLAGWAGLCPDCLGRAGENAFLAWRLRAALRERSAVSSASVSRAQRMEDWYLRRGAFALGPLHDVPWQAELDEVTRWLDGLEIGGTVVEPAAGTGWWSPLLAGRAELWAYEVDDESLEQARSRLLAHRARAHLHHRDLLARALRDPSDAPPADGARVDVVFLAFVLGEQDDAGLAATLEAAHGWLRPGGLLALLEARAALDAGPIEGPRGPLRPRPPAGLEAALDAAGFEAVELRETSRWFVMGRAASRSHILGP